MGGRGTREGSLCLPFRNVRIPRSLAVKVLKVEKACILRLADGVQAVKDGDRVHRDPERGVPRNNRKNVRVINKVIVL